MIIPINRPNLFSFATSELSQDAFLAWLLSWSSNDALRAVEAEGWHRLREASQAFLAMLLDKAEVTTAKIVEIRLQWKNIDLYFHGVDERGDPFSLVIEDKTNTQGHDQQLERYKEIAKKEGHGNLYLVYLKTGWWSPADERNLQGYKAIRREDVCKCLRPFSNCHPILDDYLDNLKWISTDIALGENGALSAAYVADAFTSHAGLHAFLNEAFNPSIDGKDGTWLEYGVGLGGQPWAHWSFAWEKIHPESKEKEGFFWRVDTRKGQAIISLRKYWDHGGLVDRKELAAHRFQVYLKAVESTLKALGSGFVPSKLAARRSSYKEQELLQFTLGHSSKSNNLNDPRELAGAIGEVIHPNLVQALLAARREMATQ